jgi:hypothetical protein
MAKEKNMAEEPKEMLGFLISRLPNPITLSYGGQGMVLPPRFNGKKYNPIDKNKLGALPTGVIFIEQGRA